MDARLQALVDGVGMAYEEIEGAVKFTVPVSPDSDRTQLVFVLKSPDRFGDHEDFDITSPAAKASVVTGPIALKLLQLNGQKKVGGFQITGDMLVFRVDFPASGTLKQFVASMVLVAQEADAMEKLLTKGGDSF